MTANKKDSVLRAIPPVVIVAVALAGGCAVGPNYQRPAIDTPGNYRFASTQTGTSIGDLQWRQVFTDPQLQALIATALTNNYNIIQAAARVEQARNAAIVARAGLFPQIGYGGDIGRGKNALFNSPFGLNGGLASSALLNVNAFWEIDFWGRIRRLSEAARAQYLATDEARRAVTISEVSEIAIAYYQLLDLDQELEIQRQATNAYAGSYRIFNDRRLNGVASKLETDRAEAAFADAASTIPQLEIQIGQTEDRINLLLGHNPGPVARGSLTNTAAPQVSIPAGLPSDLLLRRPDVRQSEQLLVAANANIGANLANFFPRIGLTTFFGRASPELSEFTSGSGNFWNVGATLTGPLFQGGQLKAQYKAAKASFDEAKAAYQQSVLTAFQEVSDSLIAREKLADTLVYDVQEVNALASSVSLATDRYINGKSSYFEVLEAQQQLYPAQRSQVQTQAGEWITVVQLYQALGGGWQFENQTAIGPKQAPQKPQTQNPQPANPS